MNNPTCSTERERLGRRQSHTVVSLQLLRLIYGHGSDGLMIGASGILYLTQEQVTQMRNWLTEWLKTRKGICHVGPITEA